MSAFESNYIHQYFEYHASDDPNKTAVKYRGECYSFDYINRKANQTARYLIKSGIEPGDIAAIFMERSVHMIIAIFAILKAGGAYLPMSMDFPDERKRYILSNSRAKALIISDDNENISVGIPVVNIVNDFIGEDEENINLALKQDQMSCVLYTSVSTGFPKGVMLKHSSFINNLAWSAEEYDLSDNDVILQRTPYTFDASAWKYL